MLSLTNFRLQLSHIVEMTTGDGLQLKVHYMGRVYIITIEPTYERHKRAKSKKPSHRIKPGLKLVTRKCKNCGSVVVGSICVNPNCKNL